MGFPHIAQVRGSRARSHQKPNDCPISPPLSLSIIFEQVSQRVLAAEISATNKQGTKKML
jgi:hypothetical protein